MTFNFHFHANYLIMTFQNVAAIYLKIPNIYTFFYSLKIIPYMVYILWYQNSSIFPLNTQTSKCTDLFVYKLLLHKSARKVLGSLGKGKGLGGKGGMAFLRKHFFLKIYFKVIFSVN